MTGRHRQRGAATVIAAVFLVVSLSLMVNVALHMAGSDINDTAMHSDAIEALFIAETGLEQASYWYDSGVACAALVNAPYNSDNVARGTFTINGTLLVSSRCWVTVEGVVDQTYAVKRTIQGELAAGGGAGGVWAVGKDGIIKNWDGTNWGTSDTLSEDLYAVTCTSDGTCWAVGKEDNDESLIAQWNGNSWSTASNDFDEDLNGVTCVDSNNCWAVGKDGMIVRGLSGVWSDSGFNNDAPDDELHAVTCIAANDCWAVGEDGTIVYWDGSEWTDDDVDNDAPDKELLDVHCVAANDCWAVGEKDGSDLNIVYWDGSDWTPVDTGLSTNTDLNGISCVSSNDCWAVGKKRGSQATILHWDGNTWSDSGFTNNAPNEDLTAVHCTDSGDCWAVGDDGSAVRLTGGDTWNEDSPGGDDLSGVFISGGGGGSTRLISWQELVN